jgi:hypothetical protein
MTRFLLFVGARLQRLRLLFARVSLSPSTLGRAMGGLSVLGLVALAYLCGAAIMYFRLPSSDFLDQAFRGAKAWQKRGQSTMPLVSPGIVEKDGITVDKAEKTYDGFTLYTMADASHATLIDMRGAVVHRWALPFHQVWPRASHVEDPVAEEQIYWAFCYLYANGDLLAIYQAHHDTPYGYGLVKLDKDSKLLWAYANNVHHEADVAEDGTIYTLTQKIVHEPPVGLEFLPKPCITESLVVLSPQGQELETIPLLEVFAQSPYAPILDSVFKQSSIGRDPLGNPLPRSQQLILKEDVLHTNSVEILSRALAAKYPLFKPGQVLLSFRNLDTIAVLDPATHRVVWAARGIWRLQHNAKFLDNGRLLLYDNLGSRRTRILEYDLQTQAFPWLYGSENSRIFSANFRGVNQRLPNGNTLIVDPDNRRLFEVTQDKELVWQISCGLSSDPRIQSLVDHGITFTRRYRPDELTFLKGVARARP